MWCVPQLSPLILYRGASCVVCNSAESTDIDIVQGCQLSGVCAGDDNEPISRAPFHVKHAQLR